MPHLLEALLFREAGVAWQHVAYPGGPPAVIALIGGQIAALAFPEGILKAHHTAGKVRVLATSGQRRSDFMPDVPTFIEQGFEGLLAQEWFALFMHGGVVQAQVEAASRAVGAALSSPALVSSFAATGMVVSPSSPSTLAARISSEQKAWEPIIRLAGIRGE